MPENVIDITARKHRDDHHAMFEWYEANNWRLAGCNTDEDIDVWVLTEGDRATVHVVIGGRVEHRYLMPTERVAKTVEAHIRPRPPTTRRNPMTTTENQHADTIPEPTIRHLVERILDRLQDMEAKLDDHLDARKPRQ